MKFWGRHEKEKIKKIQEFKDSNLEHETLNEKKAPQPPRNVFLCQRRLFATFLSSFGVEFTRARIYHAHTVVKNTARISPTLSLRRTFICTSRFTRYFRKNVHDDCDSASCGCGDERCARHLLLVLHLRCGISVRRRRTAANFCPAVVPGREARKDERGSRMNDTVRVARVHLGKRYRSRSERSSLRRLPNSADFSRCFSF